MNEICRARNVCDELCMYMCLCIVMFLKYVVIDNSYIFWVRGSGLSLLIHVICLQDGAAPYFPSKSVECRVIRVFTKLER